MVVNVRLCDERHEEDAVVGLGRVPVPAPEQGSAGAAARLAAVLFAGDAAIGLVTLGLVPADLHDREVIAAVSVGSASIALALARLLPWHRWSFASLLWAFAPLYVVELGARASVGPTIGLSVRAVLAFVWLGLFFRPRAAVFGVAAVLGAILLGGGEGIEPLQLRGLLMAVPVWLFVAIVLAQLQRRRREVEQLAERAFEGGADRRGSGRTPSRLGGQTAPLKRGPAHAPAPGREGSDQARADRARRDG